MKTSKLLLGGLSGGVAFFLLGWLVYGVLLMDYTMANSNQCASLPMEEMKWWSIILSNLIFGFLLANVIAWSGAKGMMAGAKVAGILGILMSATIDFSFYSMTSMFSNFTALVVDVVVFTVISSVCGALIGWVFGMGEKSS